MTEFQAHDPLSDEQARAIVTDTPCLACGYNLRGLNPDGFCPECGHSNLRTVEHRRSMTKRELAALAFRIAAIWMALGWIEEFLRTWGNFYGGNWIQVVMSAGSAGLYILVNVMLWLKADVLAKYAISHDGPISLCGNFIYQQCLSIAFSVIGMVYIVYAISDTSWAISAWLSDTWQKEYSLIRFVSSAMSFVIGCVLLVGAGKIARTVMWLRTAGIRTKSEKSTKY